MTILMIPKEARFILRTVLVALFTSALLSPASNGKGGDKIVIAKRDMPKGTVIRSEFMTTQRAKNEYDCECPQPKSKFLGKVLKFDVYRGQAITLCDLGINQYDYERCLRAVHSIRKGEKITKENVRVVWTHRGKGDPTGSLPDLPKALGKELRWDLLQDRILEDHDLKQSTDSPEEKKHG